MKKLLAAALLCCTFALAACGNKGDSGKKDGDGGKTTYSETVLEDKTAGTAYVLAGNIGFQVGNEVKAGDWGYVEGVNVMKATSVKVVSEKIGTAVADKLAANSKLKYLYLIENVALETDEKGFAGWTTKALVNGEVKTLDGGYAFKGLKMTYDEEDDKWLKAQHYPDPHTQNAESLTPETWFVPPFVEEADANGFSWSSNPAVTSGAGIYNVAFAIYDVTADESNPAQYTCGMAVKLVEQKTEYEPPVVTDHTFGLIGSFNSWGGDVELEKVSDGVYEVEQELEADAEVKVRLDGAWTTSWGYESVASPDAEIIADNGGNIKVLQNGTYKFTLSVTFDADNNVTAASIAVALLTA